MKSKRGSESLVLRSFLRAIEAERYVQESMETNMLAQNRFCTFAYFAAFFILFFCDVCHVCEYNSMIGEDKQRMTFSEPFLSPPSIRIFSKHGNRYSSPKTPTMTLKDAKVIRGTAAQLGESDRFMYKPLGYLIPFGKFGSLKRVRLALGNIKSQEA